MSLHLAEECMIVATAAPSSSLATRALNIVFENQLILNLGWNFVVF